MDGHMGLAKPVFDLDSVQLLDYLSRMNGGLQVEGQPGKLALLEGTNFFLGCVVSPFKSTEPEVMTQYYKLEKKVRAGADYVIAQLGYDARKHHELLRYMRDRGIHIPLIGSVFVLSRGAARLMNRGEVPGCVVTDDLLTQVEAEYRSPDRGKKASMERAARQIAVLRGLGYSGAHIEGFGLRFDDVRAIIERSEELEENWQEYAEPLRFSPEGTFYLFGGGGIPPVRRSVFRSWRAPIRFSGMWVLHRLVFRVGTVGYTLMRRLSAWLDAHRHAMRVFYGIERRAKALLFGCRDCGDCVLPEMHFLCPESRCPKFQRVGPCGGSHAGRCEVFKDRFCVWYLVYERAKATGTLEELRDYLVSPRNWTLYGTSSWVNFYLGRDHTGNRLRGRRWRGRRPDPGERHDGRYALGCGPESADPRPVRADRGGCDVISRSIKPRAIEDLPTGAGSSSRNFSSEKSDGRRIGARIPLKEFIPREHGAWPMLLVPLFVGASVASTSGKVGLLLSAAVFAHVARHMLLTWIRLRAVGGMDRRALLLFMASSALASAFFLLLVLGGRPLLLPFGGGALLFMALHIFQRLKHTERTVRGELLGIAGLTMTAPAAYYVATGKINTVALTLWLLNFLYFGRSVFYVKMKIAARGRGEDFGSLAEKLRFSRTCVLYCLAMIAGVLGLGLAGLIPFFTWVAFVPISIQTIRGISKLRGTLRIRRLGFIELGYAILFGLVLIIVFRFI